MSLCKFQALSVPTPSFDPIAILKLLLKALGISLPQMPSVPFIVPYCPLD